VAALGCASRQCGWKLLAEVTQMGSHSLYLYYDCSQRVQLLTIDVVTDLTWGWMPTCSVSHVLATKVPYRGIPVAAPGADAAIRVIKTVLRGRLPDARAWPRICDYARKQPDAFRAVFRGHADPGIVDSVLEVIGRNDSGALAQLGPRLRRSVVWHAHARAPLRQALRLVAYFASRMQRFRQGALGALVVIVGPDGTGKTTLVKRLSYRVGSLLFRGTKVYHTHFAVLPRLRSIVRTTTGARVREIDFTRKHSGSEVKPHGLLRSLLYVSYYTLEYFFGHLLVWRLKGQSRLILFDRYFYDYYFQRGNNKLPHWLLNLFRGLVPQPDVVIVLKADPAVVYGRKPELLKEDIHRMMGAAEQVAGTLAPRILVRTIRTDLGEQVAEEQAVRAILRSVRRRNYGEVEVKRPEQAVQWNS
jgi:thymidylate kinase